MKLLKRGVSILAASAVMMSNTAFLSGAVEEIEETAQTKSHVFDVNIDSKKWTDDISDWVKVKDDNIRVYYKTSEYNTDDWGSYDDAFLWDDADTEFPEGKGYIKFWGVDESGTQGVVCQEEKSEYKFDKTRPAPFDFEAS